MAIEVVTLKYLYAKEAKDLFVKVLSSRGDVQVNESTNSLIFMDFAENLQKVKALAEEVDQPPLQVLIEARLVDIKTTDMRKIGTEISATYTAPRGHLGTIGLQTGSSTKQSDGGQLALSPSFKHLDASVTIDALIAQSRARILASPSIATLSGLEARIIIGDRIPYTSASSTITAGTGNTTTTTETKFLEVGTTLKVTPLVSSDGWITMKIHPEVSSFVKFVDDNPQTTTREADATIRVRDNETIIIGGLISKTKNDQDNGVPGLRSIPLVGRLFRRTENQDDQSELMVFITPHIIRSSPDKPYLQEAPSEVFVDIQKNVDQDLLSGLLGYADSLERDLVAKPSDSLYLNAELLKTYKMIYDQYPQAGRADYCLYKMIMIYVREFDKCQAAQEILTSLRRGFPESPYLGAAEKIARSCAEITLPAMSVPEGTERN